MQEVCINIEEDEGEGVIWLGVRVDGKLYFKQPLARVFRNYFDLELERVKLSRVEAGKPVADDRGERAFAKMALNKSIQYELNRA